MKKNLPEIEIEGTTFLFDIDRCSLIEKYNPYNEIYFEYMHNDGTNYSFEYSAVSKNFHFVRSASTIDEVVQEIFGDVDSKGPNIKDPAIPVKIPRIGVLDPDGMCRKYRCTLRDIALKTDFEIMVNQDVFNRRMNGEPVTIDLVGHIYEIDVKENTLRPKDGTGEEIRLDIFHYDLYYEDMEVYHLFYNISECKAVNPLYDGSIDRTEDRVILEVPNLESIDPIGSRLAYGRDPRSGLMGYDLSMNHVARIVPWKFYDIKIPLKQKQKNIAAKTEKRERRKGRKI
jgi:hypothetical protein